MREEPNGGGFEEAFLLWDVAGGEAIGGGGGEGGLGGIMLFIKKKIINII